MERIAYHKFEDISGYRYKETVFVTGEVVRYVEDLESHFRYSQEMHKRTISSLEKEVKAARSTKDREGMIIKIIEDYRPLMHSTGQTIHIPWQIQDIDGAIAYLEKAQGFSHKVYKNQRINQSLLGAILDGREEIEALDITNYGHVDHIVQIKYLAQQDRASNEEHNSAGGGSIRMRVFFDDSARSYDGTARRFAGHASLFRGVNAKLVVEPGVNVGKELIDIDTYLKDKKPIRSRLRVVEPFLDLTWIGKDPVYSCRFSDAERHRNSRKGKN